MICPKKEKLNITVSATQLRTVFKNHDKSVILFICQIYFGVVFSRRIIASNIKDIYAMIIYI